MIRAANLGTFQALPMTSTEGLTMTRFICEHDTIEPIFQRGMIDNVIVDWDDDG